MNNKGRTFQISTIQMTHHARGQTLYIFYLTKAMSIYPNVGISAIELYFPSRYIDQTVFEEAHNCKGKYTKGLGQERMAFTGFFSTFCGLFTHKNNISNVDELEDSISLALTVTHRLIEHHSIDVQSVGRIEVGTETIIDHSKSIKTHLIDLFAKNPFLEGVDCVNACFGGTQALFNTIDYVKLYGKNAIVVATDIAAYGGPVFIHYFLLPHSRFLSSVIISPANWWSRCCSNANYTKRTPDRRK